jgi:sensor histidine kinase regulating citrate/malate metabolism
VVADGEIRGLVAVGVRREHVDHALRGLVPDIAGSVAAVALLSGLGALVIARRVRRQTLGLSAAQLALMHDHHDAVLHGCAKAW